MKQARKNGLLFFMVLVLLASASGRVFAALEKELIYSVVKGDKCYRMTVSINSPSEAGQPVGNGPTISITTTASSSSPPAEVPGEQGNPDGEEQSGEDEEPETEMSLPSTTYFLRSLTPFEKARHTGATHVLISAVNPSVLHYVVIDPFSENTLFNLQPDNQGAAEGAVNLQAWVNGQNTTPVFFPFLPFLPAATGQTELFPMLFVEPVNIEATTTFSTENTTTENIIIALLQGGETAPSESTMTQITIIQTQTVEETTPPQTPTFVVHTGHHNLLITPSLSESQATASLELQTLLENLNSTGGEQTTFEFFTQSGDTATNPEIPDPQIFLGDLYSDYGSGPYSDSDSDSDESFNETAPALPPYVSPSYFGLFIGTSHL